MRATPSGVDEPVALGPSNQAADASPDLVFVPAPPHASTLPFVPSGRRMAAANSGALREDTPPRNTRFFNRRCDLLFLILSRWRCGLCANAKANRIDGFMAVWRISGEPGLKTCRRAAPRALCRRSWPRRASRHRRLAAPAAPRASDAAVRSAAVPWPPSTAAPGLEYRPAG